MDVHKPNPGIRRPGRDNGSSKLEARLRAALDLEYPTRVRPSAAARHRSKNLHRRFEVGPVMQTDPNDRRITRLKVEGEASVTELLIGGSTIGLFRRRVPCV